MPMAELLSLVAAELALLAGIGFLLFTLNDLLVDLIYFGRAMWRAVAIRPRFPRLFAEQIEVEGDRGTIAVFIPAWDESAVIAPMLRATLDRFDHPDYRQRLAGNATPGSGPTLTLAGDC